MPGGQGSAGRVPAGKLPFVRAAGPYFRSGIATPFLPDSQTDAGYAAKPGAFGAKHSPGTTPRGGPRQKMGLRDDTMRAIRTLTMADRIGAGEHAQTII